MQAVALLPDKSTTRRPGLAVRRSSPPVKTNEILGGKFRVGKMIQRGGMSVVYEAQHIQLGQTVAVKVLHGTKDPSNGFESALLEAKATARLTSEHVVRAMDIGVTWSGHAYLVMEKLEGRDLDRELRGGPLSIAAAIGIALQACTALAEAHACGIVHRDIKPSNLFLVARPDGSLIIKVLDFGLAKTAGTADPEWLFGSVAGSPGYASPEQLGTRADVDGRTDIWALGALVYKMITGRKPFEVDNLEDTLIAAVTKTVPPMTSPYEEVPPELEAVVLKCLQMRREDRYDSVLELMDALAPFCPAADMGHPLLSGDHGLRAVAPAVSEPLPSDENATVRDPTLSVAPARRPLPFILLGSAGGLLVALLLIACLTIRPSNDVQLPMPVSPAPPLLAPVALSDPAPRAEVSEAPEAPAPPPVRKPPPVRAPRPAHSSLDPMAYR